jgi:subtilase family serine protease
MRRPRLLLPRLWSPFSSYLLHLIWAGLLLGSCFSSYAAAQEKATIAQTPLAVQGGSATVTGHYDPNNMLRLVFTLTPPHLDDEEQLLRQIQDPQSPLFHRYLSEQEWNERFAPAPQDEQEVVTWAQSQGLTITQRYANRLLVEVEAPAGIIERALDVSINTYRIGEERYFSNDRDPSVPARLGGVIHSVLGLNNIEVLHTFSNRSDVRPPDYTPGPAYAVGPHVQRNGNRALLHSAMQAQAGVPRQPGPYGPYAPGDLYSANAYDYSALQLLGICCNPTNNPNNSPPQASIAIAIWGDFDNSDFDGFLNAFPYLASNVQRYFVGGTPSCCYPETTMDVEWSTAMANSFHLSSDTALINVYEGTDNSPSIMLAVINRILSDGYARVLTMSWGGAENSDFTYSQMQNFHAVFNQMVGQGWTLVAASGDGGATTSCQDRLAASYRPLIRM